MKNSIFQLFSFFVLFCATSFSAMADATEFNGYWRNQVISQNKTVASINVQANPNNGQFAKITLQFSDQRHTFAMRASYNRGALVANNVNLGCPEKYQIVFRIMRNRMIQVSFRPLIQSKPAFQTCGYERIRANLVQFRPSTSPVRPTTTQGQTKPQKQSPRTKPVIQIGQPKPNTATSAKYPQSPQTPANSGVLNDGSNGQNDGPQRGTPSNQLNAPQTTNKQDVNMHKTPPIVAPSPQTPKKGNTRRTSGGNF